MKRKDSHRQQNPLRGSSSPYSALSQRELLDPMKPVYTQSRPDGRFKLTAGVFSRLLTNNENGNFSDVKLVIINTAGGILMPVII